MGFWKRNREKIFTDTISGVLIRLIGLVLFVSGSIYIGHKIVSYQTDTHLIRDILTGIFILVVLVIVLLFAGSPLFLEWLSYVRESKIRESELENEKLKLELELLREKQKSQPDDEESV